MGTQDKLSEIRYHDDHVKSYGRYEAHPDEEYYRILRESRILDEAPSLVLDLGCGSGAFGLRLARLGFTVVGIDISKVSITSARDFAKDDNLEAHFLVADVERIPFRGCVFPAVFCGFILHHVPDALTPVLHEVYRVLKPKRKLFLCEPNSLNIGSFIQYHFGSDRTANERALNPKELKDILESAGFMDLFLKDIGDLKHLRRDGATPIRELTRKLIFIALGILNRLPFLPGAFFILRATRKAAS
ncbi:MAG: class I SAM-dependent methyltransferase [Candidatus Geothermarchaeales archaeon]